MRNRVSILDFEFTSPSPNFDRTKVKGLVANLVSLRQEDYNKSTALEITAGGRLYNVVVATEQVGKELLQNGRLKKRVTIIPLNKIDSRTISASVRLHVSLRASILIVSSHAESSSRNETCPWQSSSRHGARRLS